MQTALMCAFGCYIIISNVYGFAEYLPIFSRCDVAAPCLCPVGLKETEVALSLFEVESLGILFTSLSQLVLRRGGPTNANFLMMTLKVHRQDP